MNRIKKTIYLYGLVTILSVSGSGCAWNRVTIEGRPELSGPIDTVSDYSEEGTEDAADHSQEESSGNGNEKDPTKDPNYISIEEKEAILAQYDWLGVVHNTTGGVLNVRMEPSTSAFIMGKAFENSAVHIVEDLGEWYKIEEHGAYGYVSKKFIVTGEEARTLAMDNIRRRAVVNAAALNIRKGPSTHTNVLGRAVSQNSYAVKEEYEHWMKIQVSADQEGFVHSDYVDIVMGLDTPIISEDYSNLSQTRRNLVNMAWSYMGGKYVWGGTELGVGVDCSGFTMRLYEAQGIRLLRVARAQATQGRAVTPEEMKPGDLVFYYMGNNFIRHVAMYAGNGKIIHAASEEKGIRMDNYDYVPYAFIRNIIGD